VWKRSSSRLVRIVVDPFPMDGMAWHGIDGSKIENAKGMTFPLALRLFGFNGI